MPDTNNNASTNTQETAAATVPVQQTTQQVTQPAAQQNAQVQQPAAQPTVKTFTQEEVNAIAAREKKEGARSVLNKYGLTEDQLKGIAQVLAPPAAQPTAALTQATTVDNSETLQRLLNAETRAELAISGVRADAVEDMATLVTARLKLDSYTPDDIKEAIKEIKTRHAASFGTQTNVESGVTGQQSNNSAGTGGNFAGGTQTSRATTLTGGEPGSLGKMLASKRPK